MADHTISVDQVGVYEIRLEPNTVTSIEILGPGANVYPSVQVTVHDSEAPVYARRGNTVITKDPQSVIVSTGTWVEIPTGPGKNRVIALICASPATVSVSRA